MKGTLHLANTEVEDREKLLDRLSPEDFRSRYDQIRNDRVEGSGSWLYKSDKFQDWANGTSNLLIISGTGTISPHYHR
jgi:hypothetical protein